MLRRLFKINNPNLVKRTILKIKNLIQKIKTKIKNRLDLNRIIKTLQEDLKQVVDEKLNSQFQVDKLREQLIQKQFEFTAMKNVLNKKCDELVDLKIKKIVEKKEIKSKSD